MKMVVWNAGLKTHENKGNLAYLIVQIDFMFDPRHKMQFCIHKLKRPYLDRLEKYLHTC
jgi:hypothetical protein